MMTELLVMQDLNEQQKLLFNQKYSDEKKDPTTAVIITLLLGGIGGHKFYMGETGMGIVYLLFFWTFIPSFVALIELFTISGKVKKYNDSKAVEVALLIKSIGKPSEAVKAA